MVSIAVASPDNVEPAIHEFDLDAAHADVLQDVIVQVTLPAARTHALPPEAQPAKGMAHRHPRDGRRRTVSFRVALDRPGGCQLSEKAQRYQGLHVISLAQLS